MTYSKERAGKGRSLTLEEIVSFINRLEQNVPSSRLNMVVSMPKGGSALDSIQSNNTTLNGFNSIDGHTLTGVFTAAFSSHHNRRQQFNRGSTRGGSYNRGQSGNSFNKTRYSDNFTRNSNNFPRSTNNSSVGRRPNGVFNQSRPQLGVSQGFSFFYKLNVLENLPARLG